MSNPHIHFNSDSPEKRIKAWKTAVQAKRQIDNSFQLFQNSAWNNRLGTKEELESARTVVQNSLDKVGRTLTPKDIHLARERKLLNEQELRLAETYQAKSKLKSFRKGRAGRDRDNGFER